MILPQLFSIFINLHFKVASFKLFFPDHYSLVDLKLEWFIIIF